MMRAVIVVLTLFVAPAALAINKGDTCKLKSSLPITMKGANGTIESVLEKGTELDVLFVGDGGFSRVRAGGLQGSVSTLDLEGACAGSLEICKVQKPITMYEENRSDSKAYQIKPGASMSLLKRGKTWVAVRVNDLVGFVKAPEMDGACAERSDFEKEEAPSAEAIERNEGPGVLFLPFQLEKPAPVGAADALLDMLYDRAAYYRPDAARLGVEGTRDVPWKQQVTESAARAKKAETAYVVVGRLALEAPKTGRQIEDQYVLQLALVDSKTAKVAKAIKIRPTLDPKDIWAEKVLAVLLPLVPDAPGAKLPVIPQELKGPTKGENADPAPPPTKTVATYREEAPWFANVWGYVALGAAVGAGVGSGVAGNAALDQNATANASQQTDPDRGAARGNALALAITADALGVVAASALVTSVVVFATRAGLD